MDDSVQLECMIWKLLRSLGDEAFSNTDSSHLAAVLLEFGACSIDDSNQIEARINKVKREREQLKILQELPAVAQRSQEWFDLRKERLTASDAYKVVQDKRGDRERLLRDKAFPENARFVSTTATEWGKMFEPMALRMYQARRFNIDVHDFGLIPHPTMSCFGASPDGINALGVMIEIKCPYSRIIERGKVPTHYMIQMQGQMAVCGLSECDYIECQLCQHSSMDGFVYAARKCAYPADYGIVIKVAKNSINSDEYKYSPNCVDVADTLKWYDNYQKQSASSKTDSQDVVFWTLVQIQVQRVQFNQTEWNVMVPKIEQFWGDVIQARADGPRSGSGSGSAKRDRSFIADFIDDD